MFDSDDIYRIEVKETNKINANQAQVYIRLKGTTENLAMITAHVWPLVSLTNANFTYLYDSRSGMINKALPTANNIESKANSLLKALATNVNIANSTSLDMPFDINNNKRFDYYINSTDNLHNNYELELITNRLLLKAEDAILFENSPQQALFFSRTDFNNFPDRIYVNKFTIVSKNASFKLERMGNSAIRGLPEVTFNIKSWNQISKTDYTINFDVSAKIDYFTNDSYALNAGCDCKIILPADSGSVIVYVRKSKGDISKMDKNEGIIIDGTNYGVTSVDKYNSDDYKITLSNSNPLKKSITFGYEISFSEKISLPANLIRGTNAINFSSNYSVSSWPENAKFTFVKNGVKQQVLTTTSVTPIYSTEFYYQISSSLTCDYTGSEVFNAAAYHIIKLGNAGGFSSDYDLNRPVIMKYSASADEIGYTYAHEQGHGKFEFKDVTSEENVMECKYDVSKTTKFLVLPFSFKNVEKTETGVLDENQNCIGKGQYESQWKIRDNK